MSDLEVYMKSMPTIPDVVTKIMDMTKQRSEVPFSEISKIIMVDPALSTKVLRVANSSMYSRQQEITNMQMAISLLGLKNIRDLLFLVVASGFFKKGAKPTFYSMFWKHSLYTAFTAREICRYKGKGDIAETIFSAALLHDIGKIALYNYDSAKYETVLGLSESSEAQIEDIEFEQFGSTHREVGSSVLEKWKFPDFFVDIVAQHDEVRFTSGNKSNIIIVTVANILSHQSGYGFGNESESERLESLLPYVQLPEEYINYLKTEFHSNLDEDDLFRECKSLFNIK